MKTQVFKYPNAIVRVHIPEVTESERRKNYLEMKRSFELLLQELVVLEDKESETV